jgi:hypothetical protein
MKSKIPRWYCSCSISINPFQTSNFHQQISKLATISLKNLVKPTHARMNTNQPERPHSFRTGTWVQIEGNRKRYKIVKVAAWSDTNPKTPSHYDVSNNQGNYHRMIPAERISLCGPYREFRFSMDVSGNHDAAESSSRQRLTHCWSCKVELSSDQNPTCAKCSGLACACGNCLCKRLWNSSTASELRWNLDQSN